MCHPRIGLITTRKQRFSHVGMQTPYKTHIKEHATQIPVISIKFKTFVRAGLILEENDQTDQRGGERHSPVMTSTRRSGTFLEVAEISQIRWLSKREVLGLVYTCPMSARCKGFFREFLDIQRIFPSGKSNEEHFCSLSYWVFLESAHITADHSNEASIHFSLWRKWFMHMP